MRINFLVCMHAGSLTMVSIDRKDHSNQNVCEKLSSDQYNYFKAWVFSNTDHNEALLCLYKASFKF